LGTGGRFGAKGAAHSRRNISGFKKENPRGPVRGKKGGGFRLRGFLEKGKKKIFFSKKE